MYPTTVLCPRRRLRAPSWGEKPRDSIAARTRSRVAGAIRPGWWKKLDTVVTDTPASAATSRMVDGPRDSEVISGMARTSYGRRAVRALAAAPRAAAGAWLPPPPDDVLCPTSCDVRP